ncbi:lipoate-protein ligase LplJ [Synergistales bacterium]|nr:lipoate-protein ligase LplJ [Synergistales bacterium]
MLYIEPESTDASFHFAAEDYCMKRFCGESVWMLWRADKCAMLGSNQIADAEIDLGAAAAAGVRVVRRASGGGTIFTDLGTLLYTVILPYNGGDVKRLERVFVIEPMVRALNDMRIDAKIEGRNDILLDGKKISGLAQHLSRNCLCTHGSLLYDTDLDTLSRVLRPDEEKIKSKALRSVSARVANIASYMEKPLTLREFWNDLKQNIFKTQDLREYKLTEEDISEIQKIRLEKYASDSWTFGKTPRFSFHNKKRFPMGGVEVFLDVEDGVVSACEIRGDFLGVTPIRALEELLEARPYRMDAIEKTLKNIDLTPYLGGVTKEQLLTCLF